MNLLFVDDRFSESFESSAYSKRKEFMGSVRIALRAGK